LFLTCCKDDQREGTLWGSGQSRSNTTAMSV
jgi:hypothetical protein